MKRTSFLALTVLAAFSLAPSAHAQSLVLQSGDNVTVTGSGTTGTYQGKPISNTTSTYYSNGANAGVGTDITVPIGAAFTLGNGAVLNGGPSGSSAVTALTVAGTATVSGGTVGGGSPYGYGIANHSGVTTITAGTVTGGTALFCDGGLIQVSGGSIRSSIHGFVASSQGGGSIFFTTGVIDLFGTFTDGSGNPLIGPILGGAGSIQGTFSNGDVLANTLYSAQNGGTIEFNVGPAPAPEPSSVAALSIGVLGLAALALRARKRCA